jgi:hypothetical protein
VNLETATQEQNRQRAPRRRIRLPEPTSSIATQLVVPSVPTQLRQRYDIAKEIPLLVPEPSSVVPDGSTERVSGRRRPTGPRAGKQRAAVRFWLLNKWQGQVLSVGKETFKAALQDLAHPKTIEHAEFFISDLPEDGRSLLRPGAWFYWMIGYRDEGSQRRRESIVWMRRSGIMGSEKFRAALNSVQRTWGELFDADQQATGQ